MGTSSILHFKRVIEDVCSLQVLWLRDLFSSFDVESLSHWGGASVTLSRLLYTLLLSATVHQDAQYTFELHNHVITVTDLKV